MYVPQLIPISAEAAASSSQVRAVSRRMSPSRRATAEGRTRGTGPTTYTRRCRRPPRTCDSRSCAVAVAQHVEGILQVGRVRGGDLDAATVRRVRKRERARVEPLMIQPKPLRQGRVRAVSQITDAGMAQRGEVHADLVCATGFQVDVEQAGRGERLHR